MSLISYLQPECIRAGSSSRTKEEALREITELAKKNPVLKNVSGDRILKAFQAREKIGSTGFGKGIAIPHCGLDEVEEFVVGLLHIPEGIDFQAMDGEKTRTIFFIVGPRSKRNQHIQILSALSKLLKNPEEIQHLFEDGDSEAIRDRLLHVLEVAEESTGGGGKCLFHVLVQREEYFDDILQIFSAVVQGSIAVIETNNAGYYLHSLPLSAAYWSDSKKTFFRVILAVVDRDLCNDIIRRINMVSDTLSDEPGVLIAVQELFYTSGSVAF